MRISDWSSDVCSSDLAESRVGRTTNLRDPVETGHGRFDGRHVFSTKTCDRQFLDEADVAAGTPHRLCDPEARLTLIEPLAHDAGAVCAFVNDKIGRASCRERVWQYG